MKKLIAIMLVLCMALSLAACAAPAAPATQEAPEAEGTEEAASLRLSLPIPRRSSRKPKA